MDWPMDCLGCSSVSGLRDSTRIEFQCQIAQHMIQCQPKVACPPSPLSPCPYIVSSDLQPSLVFFFPCLACLTCPMSFVFCLSSVFSSLSFLGICCRWRHFGLGLRLLPLPLSPPLPFSLTLGTEVASGAIGHLYR